MRISHSAVRAEAAAVETWGLLGVVCMGGVSLHAAPAAAVAAAAVG
jgi:hypothetical protein